MKGYPNSYFVNIFFLVLICIAFAINAKEKKPVHYTVYVKEIIKSFSQEMEKDYGIKCIGSGGSMPYDVKKINMMFVAYQKSDCEEARRLGVAAVQKLLQHVNQHEKIRPYLHQYPFTEKNLWINIFFYDDKNQYHLDDTVAVISLLSGKIIYDKAEVKKVFHPATIWGETGEVFIPSREEEEEVLVPIKKESYEEALQIVEKEKAL